ncbi:MAG TPA: sialidase family protein [Acidobacteriota bacterium]|nr:sialidase family protein [Acidobacteriota bacterium]
MRNRKTLFYPAVILAMTVSAVAQNSSSQTTYNINTLAGKVASLNGTAGLQIRFSALIEHEAGFDPDEVLSSDGGGSALDPAPVVGPNVIVNQDTKGAPQNETAIAVDPNNPMRIVGGINDYVTGTWPCSLPDGTPCSALGDAYSGTYFSNDGGTTWCCLSTDPSHLGTLIPGVEHLTGGPYDAGGDPVVAFDSQGNVYYAGLGFDRTAPPNTVAVNKGNFDGTGNLTWGAPVFINQTTAPSTLNDKPWMTVDANPSSPFRDRVYVTWTRFIFNPHNGRYVQSPIALSVSRDGGKSFSDPKLIVDNVLYDQGSNVVVGPDGTVYAFWDGSTRHATLDSIWMVKSTDGGLSWSKPVAVSTLVDIVPLASTAFRVNSYPAGAVAPNGDVYVSWTGLMSDSGGLCPAFTNNGCHSTALYSKSTDGGTTWSAPAAVFAGIDASTRTPVGYPVTQPDGSMMNAPAPRRIDTLWPRIAFTPSGHVYMGAYAAGTVSPYFNATSKTYINNALLDYVVTDLAATEIVSTKPLNTRFQFGGGFIGDYTGLAVGTDERFHAFWNTTTPQTIDWWFGTHSLMGVVTNSQDVVTAAGIF